MSKTAPPAAPDAVERHHSPEELAREHGLLPDHVRSLIRRGELRAFKVGRRTIIPASAVAEFFGSLPPCKPDDAA
jgi:excisionase family DNA binding protein